MKQAKYEPFGEAVNVSDRMQSQSHTSKLLTRIGAAVFWLLAGTIVIARGVYFEPGIFDAFGRVIAYVQKLAQFS
ncbi:MAG: hypothetical protein HY242_05150 [Afipia sp.]|nr:hypothetical protein [Afipia sp.]